MAVQAVAGTLEQLAAALCSRPAVPALALVVFALAAPSVAASGDAACPWL